MSPLETPDGRYIVVRGRLWRRQRPDLEPSERDRLVHALMDARRAVGTAKRGLGERGPVWWTDGTPNLDRHMVANTPYADWYEALPAGRRKGGVA